MMLGLTTEIRASAHSKERIRRAGTRLREWLQGEIELTDPELGEELVIVRDFRACHAAPLTRVGAGLRYYVEKYSSVSEKGRPVVAQRLKRTATILDKLLREPGMSLNRMADIGGCRALFGSVDEMEGLITDLKSQRRWEIRRIRNYVEDPRPGSGYRAIHVIVRKDGILIECQLRTITQHAWAELIERTDRRTGIGLKAARAPAEVTEYYRLGADLLAQSDAGRDRDPETLRRFQELHPQVQRHVERNESS